MKMLTAQAIADEGELEVLGFRLPGESKQARAECGVVPQLDNLDTTLTVEQNLRRVHPSLPDRRVPSGAPRSSGRSRSPTSATAATRRVDKLSGGMRRRLLIARALVHRPRMLLLDEPTVGLDPQVRQELWALIDGLRTEGVSILMSTHYIEEAERLADTVTIMSHGHAVADAARPHGSSPSTPGARRVEVYGAARAARRGGARPPGKPGCARGGPARPSPSCGLDSANGDTPEGERRPANLEDVFVLLTGEEIA